MIDGWIGFHGFGFIDWDKLKNKLFGDKKKKNLEE